MTTRRILVLGAAGRDFHNFNVTLRDDPDVRVVGFTATQIPKIEGRCYPPSLAGSRYPEGVPIVSEDRLEECIVEEDVDEAVFAYSDVSWDAVGHVASRALAAGADLRILGTRDTLLQSSKPVVAVTAVRTGCGKSPVTRYLAAALRDADLSTVVVRHPMPYGDLAAQAVQRFASVNDLDTHHCTFEEREEYESHINEGSVVFAGVDYEAILRQAEQEADVILWDGGNNDWPFFRPDVWITIADPLRCGDERHYFPSEVHVRNAHIIVINKADAAPPDDVEILARSLAHTNPHADIIRTSSVVSIDGGPDAIRGKRVLCIEDGPTLTHGGMTRGAAGVAAEQFGATIIDPRRNAVRSIAETLHKFPHIGPLLPAIGYYPDQIRDLEDSINAADCDAVLVGTPFDLAAKLNINVPAVRVRYDAVDLDHPTLAQRVLERLADDALLNRNTRDAIMRP